MKTGHAIRAMAAAALMFLMSSCTSSSFMGLSKSSHVDAELEDLKAEIAYLESLKSDLELALDNEDRLQESIEELNRLASDLSEELDDIPDETLRQLVSAIEAYLASPAASEATEAAGTTGAPAGSGESGESPENN